MSGALVRAGNWERQDDYGYQLSYPSHRWRVPAQCVPPWRDESIYILKTISLPDERTPQELLNAKIDNLYGSISALIAQRTSKHDPMLEEQITSLFQKLRSLQKQEADMVREYTKELLGGPIAEGLEILRNAKQIRAKHGIVATTDAAPSDSDVSKT